MSFDPFINNNKFRSTLERIYIKSPQNPNISIGTNNYFNFSSPTLNLSDGNHHENDINSQFQLIYHDLTLAPEIIEFHNRETELETLSNWIFKQNTRLIA